ncbi:hypothetical protein DUZ99_16565 [Xylanibacillus composti]|uniref:Uncharacterized protein n=1 Tax=Xylanibacillus composti TaxID=1572762 RepID=A0A8J4H3V8_9BACL|nr:hypothetical protein [Xylanibacillus composti]MDT9726592.1 hypothetical protein [Xylanibacillus composti]GIQ69012.1 hypothetical protein XYCOK13_18360 [Xylanibacillus composti]
MKKLVPAFDQQVLAKTLVNSVFNRVNFEEASRIVKEHEGEGKQINIEELLNACITGKYKPKSTWTSNQYDSADLVVQQAICNVLYNFFRYVPDMASVLNKNYRWYIDLRNIVDLSEHLPTEAFINSIKYFVNDVMFVDLVKRIVGNQVVSAYALLSPSIKGSSYFGLLLYDILMSLFETHAVVLEYGFIRFDDVPFIFFNYKEQAEQVVESIIKLCGEDYLNLDLTEHEIEDEIKPLDASFVEVLKKIADI